MQLRLALSVPKFTGSGFNQTTSAILTGVTIAGAFATVIFQSGLAGKEVNKAFNKFASLLHDSSFGSGINKLGSTFKSWGTTIVGKKDDFVQWVHDYLNVSGFKSGAVELYQKLYEWAEIVYNWFATKFLEFLKNIPKIVEHWRSIRLSLFKWGTFLGGGGGSAIWGAMFGSGDNWAKFGDLMGHPNFAEMMSDFNQLVQDNPEAFEELGEEGIGEIIKEYLEDPDKAMEDAKELIKAQEKKKEEAEKDKEKSEEEKEKAGKLTMEEIKQQFSKQKSGNPKDPEEALWGFMGSGLKPLLNMKFGDDPYTKARQAMNEYFADLEREGKRSGETAKIKKDFVEKIKSEGAKDKLINSFASLATRAYSAYSNITKNDQKPEMLGKFFEELFKEEYTKEGEGEGAGVQVDGKIKL